MGSEGVSYQLDHHRIIFDLKKFTEKWFVLRRDSTDESPDVQEIYYQIKNSIICIILDGLPSGDENTLLNELQCLHSCSIRQEPVSLSSATTNTTNICNIYDWITESLEDLSLCSKLQILVSDKELLHNYYNSDAFLRNEIYTTALFICISSLELNQSSLLSQIDNYYSNSLNNKNSSHITSSHHSKHRRSSSHPQFSISPKKLSSDPNTLSISKSTVIDQHDSNFNENYDLIKEEKNNSKVKCLNKKISNKNPNTPNKKKNIINYFSINYRKWHSLPDLQHSNISSHRPRSKTISQPISIPQSHKNLNNNNDHSSSGSSNIYSQTHVPEFDFSSIKAIPNNSESTNSSEHSMNYPISNKTITTTTPGTSSIKITSKDINDLIPIQLVKCDDIKIYFDQSYNSATTTTTTAPSTSLNTENPIISYDSPPKSGLSPINLLSCMSVNLFTTTTTTSSDDNSSPKDLPNKYFSNNSFLPSSLPTTSNDFVSSFLLPKEGEKLQKSHQRGFYANNNYNMVFDDDFLPDMITYDLVDDNQQQQQQNHNISNAQSLAAFLQTIQFSRNNTDLERENAHFKISEAIIAIIEHMKWAKNEKLLINGVSNDNKCNTNTNYNKNKHTTDELQIRASTSSLTDKDETDDDESSTNESDNENKRHKNTILCDNSNIEENYGSVEDHTAYAEWGETNLDALSAEGVALSLISKFSDSQLPKASDLTWLISEEDVPQELLPMPESPSANPDDHFIHSFTRGTRDWAPPRQQIIFTDHSTPNRKELLQKQKYRCAGCGMKVALMYARRFRYCTYLGKYLCTGCHRNQISTIPAKVLTKWDFSYYPVCVFAYRLLEQMWTYPLFYVPDLNPLLYTKIKNLYTGKLRRVQLKYIQDFIKSCRFADKEQQMFEKIPTHLTSDPDKWAMSDFIAVKNCHLQKYILELIVKAEEHIFECMLCTARGFICELCSKDQIIYPWQSKVKRCDNCGSCFHQKCWSNKPDCVKCQRLRRRRQQLS